MTLRDLLDTLKGLGARLALHAGDTLRVEPPEVLTPTLRAALTEHHAALVALIRSEPSPAPSFHASLTALDDLGTHPVAEILQEHLRALAAGLAGADPLVRELVRAEAIARLDALGVRAPARLVDAALTEAPSDPGTPEPGRNLLGADPDPVALLGNKPPDSLVDESPPTRGPFMEALRTGDLLQEAPGQTEQ